MFIHRSSEPGPATHIDLPEIASPEVLRGWVEEISVPRHFHFESNENRRVALSLHRKLESWGYEVAFHGESRNVVAVPPGLRGPALLVGAHYDSVPGCRGADDNASAVAALLGAAQACAARGSVVFVAFNREEEGLVGSREFVAETLPGLPWTVHAAHILEMVGYTNNTPDSQHVPPELPIELPSVGDFLALLGDERSGFILKDVISTARGTTPDLPVLGLEVHLALEQMPLVLLRSDHAPFWGVGRPAVMWTDTSEFRNANYHQESDTPETLDYQFLHRVTSLLVASVLGGVAGISNHRVVD